MYNEIQKINENDLLCDLNFNGYRLVTYDTNRMIQYIKHVLGYFFYDPKGELLFSGEDFACSPCHAVDSLECCSSLLTFLTLRIGDTDKEYFANYTDAQVEFASSSDCETMQCDLSVCEESDSAFSLQDILQDWQK